VQVSGGGGGDIMVLRVYTLHCSRLAASLHSCTRYVQSCHAVLQTADRTGCIMKSSSFVVRSIRAQLQMLIYMGAACVCRFGAAVAGSGGELQQVAQELQSHENQAVGTVFLRAGQQVALTLVPRQWGGRGLLGCHLRPL
jgi:hypothetical protein